MTGEQLALPTPRRRRPTQGDRLLRYLRDVGSVSRYEAFVELGIAELASRIGELEAGGVRLRRVPERRRNRYGDEVRYTRYHLDTAPGMPYGGPVEHRNDNSE